jgi:hypothetical protein
MSEETQTRMGLDELSKTQEFASLTSKQKMAVATYISNGYDIIHAIRTAYRCKNDHIAQIMSYRFLRSFGVAMTLSRHFGSDPLDTFLAQLARDIIKGRITDTQIKAYTLYAECQGWKKSAYVRAYELAKEMGFKKDDRHLHITHQRKLKREIMAAIEEAKKPEEKEQGSETFDLSHFED